MDTATEEDVAAQNQAIFERYQQLREESMSMTPDAAHLYRFQQMQQFRTQYRRERSVNCTLAERGILRAWARTLA